jgi:hypothetical protein
MNIFDSIKKHTEEVYHDIFSRGIKIAKSVEEAKKQLRKSPVFNKDITNFLLGITARITGNNLSKMGSEKATKKSASPRLHALAVANADRLFLSAFDKYSHPDSHHRKEVISIHRLGSAIYDDVTEQNVPVILTVIEYNKDGSRVYSVEAIDIVMYRKKDPAGQLDAVARGKRQSPIAGFIYKIAESVSAVNKS